MSSNCMGGGPSGTEGEKSRVAASSGYCFSDASSSGNHHQNMQFLEPSSEIYNLSAGMEMMIGFPSKNHQNTSSSSLHLWKASGFFPKHHPSDPPSTHQLYHQQNHLTAAISDHQTTLMDHVPVPDHHHHSSSSSAPAWNNNNNNNRFIDLVEENDPCNLRSSSSVFTCQGNERPSQGLSLSLSSSNPSTIGLQSFELRQHHDMDDFRFGPSTSRSVNIQPHVTMMQGQSQLRNSKYLGPAQELLTEFCTLGIDDTNNISKTQVENENENAIKTTQPLYSLDFVDLQRRKSKLLQMLEEVDRRYRHYCDQMKGVTSSFESVAGNGAAGVYSSLASKAMSRHFRCLRDGIVGQIKATKKAMGDKDIAAAPGTVKGETPRLRVLDQKLREQRALQQMGMMDSHPWRPQRGLPERSVSVLRAWLFEHFLHPYPSDVDKHILARQTGLSRSQVSNWFINARVRLWKPMVEEMYLEEVKENEGGMMGEDRVNDLDQNDVGGGLQQTTHHQKHSVRNEDEKPSHEELVGIDSECLSSLIINNPHHQKVEAKRSRAHLGNINDDQQNPNFSGDHSYGGGGAMEMDFSSYAHHSSARGGVSLTLGLHQNGGNGNGNGNGNGGVSLAFSRPSSSSDHHQQQQQFYHHRSSEDDVGTAAAVHHHHHQYSSLLDSDQSGQALPYRNLMGAQLLHHHSFV